MSKKKINIEIEIDEEKLNLVKSSDSSIESFLKFFLKDSLENLYEKNIITSKIKLDDLVLVYDQTSPGELRKFLVFFKEHSTFEKKHQVVLNSYLSSLENALEQNKSKKVKIIVNDVILFLDRYNLIEVDKKFLF